MISTTSVNYLAEIISVVLARVLHLGQLAGVAELADAQDLKSCGR